MLRSFHPLGAGVIALLLAACGSSSQTSAPAPSATRGTLSQNPPFRIASLDAASLQAKLSSNTSGAQLLLLTGNPSCGVDFYHVEFWTVGGNKEATESSGALMVPTGNAAVCSGPRPIVLYAHSTDTNKLLDISDVTNPSNSEGVLIAAMFAAQGYIVVAPNYAGYDISTLGYHPFLNAAQQSGEMMDILAAARTALPKTFSSAASDNGKLFISGFSEGGHVAMATQRAIEAAGSKVAGAVPMSGPYAMEAFGDAIILGSVNLGSTVFVPLISTSYQKAYGNIYATPADLYSATYANGIETLLPSDTPITTIFSSGLLPQTALFNSTTPVVNVPGQPLLSGEVTALLKVPNDPGYPVPAGPQTPLFVAGFGSPYLINNSYRESYAIDAVSNPDGALPLPTPKPGAPLAAAPPTQPLRLALYTNDLRNGPWAPHSPTLLCGGDQDPTVFFSLNTGVMATFWQPLVTAHLITVLDVSAPPAGPFAQLQGAFQANQTALLNFYLSPAGGSLSPQAAQQLIVQGYHGAVAPFCARAARDFFSQL